MKLLVDMNLSPRWVGFLRAHDFEAIHWRDIGAATATDAEIMHAARDQGMIVLTHDLDFGAILAASGDGGPSVVQIRADDLSVERIGRDVVAALSDLALSLASGALATVEPGRTRARLLPFNKSLD
jgi:predicted nuclease of predicted toxin-antitoxin system